jgi:magnesium chelatase subunit I
VNTDEIVMWFDAGGALQLSDDVSAESVVKGLRTVPGLLDVVQSARLAEAGDTPMLAAACELVLEALVARRKISRSDDGRYGRAVSDKRRRPDQDYFGGLSA